MTEADKQPLFLVLEGIEGAGKSTQNRMLLEWLRSEGAEWAAAREPGGTPVGEAIREVVLHRTDLAMPAETELFLILGARAAFVRDIVEPTLRTGTHLLADRFDFSTFAYQGFGRGLPLDEVRQANHLATRGRAPDLYLVLDVPVDLGLARQGKRGAADRIEAEGHEFLSRVREGYLSLAASDERAELLDATGSPEEVQSRIREVLRARFPETMPGSPG
jgi:dTMP kinase